MANLGALVKNKHKVGLVGKILIGVIVALIAVSVGFGIAACVNGSDSDKSDRRQAATPAYARTEVSEWRR